ncbi:hypothetical protein [Streptomyces hiroshimensis]|uniref:Uncharacterized protein n=1 Tax=Streptomyces hiroshimensis TaxID=66424 RepID=A0ABQ2Y560_9ACTN|nr:hypothetical protein [Streptomyces hiroshimensis]GGX66132.1 hypothetical protein GCM10010324_09020 [Streptomyces hiroshimensis]
MRAGHSTTTDAGDGSITPDGGRYAEDMRAERQAVREAVRADAFGAHVGLVVTVLVVGAAVVFDEPQWAVVIAGACAGWFVLALVVTSLRGGGGWGAVRRAYIATFGWGDYVSP